MCQVKAAFQCIALCHGDGMENVTSLTITYLIFTGTHGIALIVLLTTQFKAKRYISQP